MPPPPTELIVVPCSVLDGLLTALHNKLDHPSKHQLQMVIQRHFFALDMSTAITRVPNSCHTCASLQKFPSALASQSSVDPPAVVSVSFAADIIQALPPSHPTVEGMYHLLHCLLPCTR